MKRFKLGLVLLSSTAVLTACTSKSNEVIEEEVEVESTQSTDRELQVESSLESIRSSSEVVDEHQEEAQESDEVNSHQEEELKYGLNAEQMEKFNKILELNKDSDLNIDLEVLARNIKNEDNYIEQVMYPGIPYAEQAEVVIEEDKVYVKKEDFAPYQMVANFETLPFGTEVRMHESLKAVSDNKYKGKILVQFTDGSSVVKDIQITLDKDYYLKDPVIYDNVGEDTLTQRYPTNEEINKKLAETDEHVDVELYESQLRELDKTPVDGKGAVENFACFKAIDIEDIKQYAIAERIGGYYLVQIATFDGESYEAMVFAKDGRIAAHDDHVDGVVEFH